MTLSNYNISFSQIEKFLEEINLFKNSGIKNINKVGVSKKFIHASIKENYNIIHKAGLDNFDYDFLLNDDSFFQFEFKQKKNIEIRYAYYQNPSEFIGYDEFVRGILEADGEHKETIEETIEEIGDMFYEEYEQHLSELNFKSNYITFRYDSDFKNYNPQVHSVSHLHVGHDNTIRIPFKKFISPMTFVLFVIKQAYYLKWKDLIKNKSELVENCLKNSIHGESTIVNEYWHELEEFELYIS
ncbi:DUF2290 domain-containing protein [Thalassobellus suaedae]|uniref:DUF2290 domain-containing protein n=1 Tax=Thalassobellus suaedae TaxID=3074124 RepID=A0ABY9XXF1_9FLAO|nr:DUF2290 domain-containing protein [Flavobacteriaceae bacterium HL-DH14]